MPSLKVNGKTVIKDPELIIFDKDGTLIDIHFYWTSMIQNRSECLSRRFFYRYTQARNGSKRID